MSGHPSKNLANSLSKSLSQGTRLKTVLAPSHTGRDHGNGWHVESSLAGSSNCGCCSSIVSDNNAFLKMSTQTYCAAFVLMALTVAGSFKSTCFPNALRSKYSLTLGAMAAN